MDMNLIWISRICYNFGNTAIRVYIDLVAKMEYKLFIVMEIFRNAKNVSPATFKQHDLFHGVMD